MKPVFLLLCLVVLNPLLNMSAHGAQTVLQDSFTNGDPFSNDGTGPNWIPANQGGGTDGDVEHSEMDSVLRLASGTGGWNIGGIKLDGPIAGGATVEVVFLGLEIVSGEDSGADRGNGIVTQLQGQISIADYTNTEAYPSGYKNDGKPALNVEIQGAGGIWGYVIHIQGSGNNSSIVEHAGVFDGEISPQSPLTVTLTVNPSGEYSVGFSLSYSGGLSSPLMGTLGAGFTNNQFVVALGNQGINNNTGYALFGQIEAIEPDFQPLQFTGEPVGRVGVLGGELVLTAFAIGTGTIRYQWYRDDVLLEGATASSLTLSELAATDAGSYTVVITDDVTSITSAPAVVTVRLLLTEFNDSFEGFDPWVNDGIGGDWLNASQDDPFNPFTEFSSTLTLYSAFGAWNIGGMQTANAFESGTTFEVTVTTLMLLADNGGRSNRGNAIAGAAIGHVALSDASNSKPFPGAFHNDEVGVVDLEIVLLDTGAYGYAVHIPVFDGNPNSGGSSIVQSGNIEWDGFSPMDVTIRLAENGDYFIRLSVPRDDVGLAPLVGNVGKPVEAVVVALGAQGVNMNAAYFSIDRVRTVATTAEAPIIVEQPRNQNVLAGNPAVFSISAVGDNLTYQWRKDGEDIEGANSATFTIASAQAVNVGVYSVIVENEIGFAASSDVTLAILDSAIFFDDQFTNGDLLLNDGIGGDWDIADQGGGPDGGVDYGEADGLARLPSASGGWNIGGIKTQNTFPAGSQVNVVFSGLEMADSSSDGADRGNGIVTKVQGQISVVDSLNVEAYPSGYKNDGRPAMNIEIQGLDDVWGFNVQKQGSGNNDSVLDHAAVFDGPISVESPLVVAIQVDPSGTYSVRFNKPYDGGSMAALTGTLSQSFAEGMFRVALGCQGVNNNTGIALFDRVQIAGVPGNPGIPLLEDLFSGDDLFSNPGAPRQWVPANQGGGTDAGLQHQESDGIAALASGSGGWNIGGIKLSGAIAADVVEVVFVGLDILTGTDGTADRGNGIPTVLQGQISITDGANTEAYPSGYKNDGKPALNIELQAAGGMWGFVVHRQGPSNDSSIVDHAHVFDSMIGIQNPLSVRISVSLSGEYVITFDHTYDGGSSAPLQGSLGAGFGNGELLVALGSQGINGNTGYALFDSVRLYGEESGEWSPLTIRSTGNTVILEWTTGSLQSSETIEGPFADVESAFSPYETGASELQLFYQLRP